MGIGLVVIDKSWQGNTWSNTYAFSANVAAGSTLALTADDLIQIGATQPFTVDNTDARPPSGAAYLGGEFLLHALVGFERLLYNSEITIDRVYVTDGRENPGTSSALYAAVPTLLPGLSPEDVNGIAPGSITLLLNRTPATLGQRPGRLYLRGVIADRAISFGGNKLVRWTDALSRQGATGFILTSLLNAEVPNYYNLGSSPNVRLGIAKYASPLFTTEPITNDLVAVAPIAGFSVVGPVARQVNKGRRRPTLP